MSTVQPGNCPLCKSNAEFKLTNFDRDQLWKCVACRPFELSGRVSLQIREWEPAKLATLALANRAMPAGCLGRIQLVQNAEGVLIVMHLIVPRSSRREFGNSPE